MRALKVRGPFRGPSGYDHHTREFVRELSAQGVAVELVDLPEWSPARLPDALRDPWFETLNRPTGAHVALHFAMPHQVVEDAGRANVNYTMFEATRVHPDWIEHGRRHTLVIVPTESSRQAWLASGLPADRVRVCPLGINPRLFGRMIQPLALRDGDGRRIAEYRVRLLNVSELGPRKNLVGLLRAWIRATSRDDDALLLIKLGRYAPGWDAWLDRELALMQTQLGKRLDEAAPVEILRELLADAEMPRLYASATHYLSLSHGEGWDQAMVEAGASGLKLIAPDHSAYQSYLDPSVARLIPSREIPAHFPGDARTAALFQGASWWEPDEEAAMEAIRAAIDGRDVHQGSPRARIVAELTWERATRALIDILDEVESAHRGRRSVPGFRRWLRG